MSPDGETVEVHRRADFLRNFECIVDGATKALAENPAASMQEIAAISGLSRATLYRHFSTREELLRAIYLGGLGSAAEAIVGAEPTRGNAPDALRRVIDGLMIVVDRYRIVAEQRLGYPDLLPRAEEAFVPLTELVERGQAEGSFRDDLPARWLTATIVSTCVAALGASGRGDIDPAEAARIVAATILEPVEVPVAGPR